MTSLGTTLNGILETVRSDMEEISLADARYKADPKKWSKIEILGHLIDSATNNYRRFISAAQGEGLVFDGYGQEEWVAIQQYQERDWPWLIDLWFNYNRLLANLVDGLPPEAFTCPHENHSLNRMAWKPVPASESTTLEYLIKDYIGHLEHHLRQILPDYQPVMIGTYEWEKSA